MKRSIKAVVLSPSRIKIAIEKIQNVFPDFVPSETLEWVENAPADTPKITLSKSQNEKYFKRENGEIFAFVGGPSTIESILNHAERINRGDIAEAILGAALSAKLIKRGSDRIGTVDNNDIQTVLSKAIATTSGTLIYTVEDKNSSIADKISFRLRLPSGSMDIIKNKKTWPKFEDLFSSAVSYANSADAEKYSNHFYRNGKVDEVLITSDGVSEQKGRKTDIDVVVRDPVTGKVRNLKSLDFRSVVLVPPFASLPPLAVPLCLLCLFVSSSLTRSSTCCFIRWR